MTELKVSDLGEGSYIEIFTSESQPNPADYGVGPIWIDGIQYWSDGATFSASSQGGGVNVDSHGAVGDGVTIDTDAIRTAITAAGTDGVLVLSPNKTYVIDAQLEPLSGQTWICDNAILKRASKIETTLTTAVTSGTGSITIDVVNGNQFRVNQTVSFYKTTWPGADESTEAEARAYIVTAKSAASLTINGPSIANNYSIGDFVISSTRLISDDVVTEVSINNLELDGNAASYINTFYFWVNHAEIRLAGAGTQILNCISRDALKEALLIGGNGSIVSNFRVYNAGGNAVHMTVSDGLKVHLLHVEGCNATPGITHQDGAISYSLNVHNADISHVYLDGKATSLSLAGGLDETTVNGKISNSYVKNILPGANGIDFAGTYGADVNGVSLIDVHLDNAGDIAIASNNAAQQVFGVSVVGCTVNGGQVRLQNTTDAEIKLTKVDNTGNTTLQCFNLNLNTRSVLDTCTGVEGNWGLGLNSGGNTDVTAKNCSFINNFSRAVSELSATSGLRMLGGNIKGIEGIVASSWAGLYSQSDGTYKGVDISGTASTGFVTYARITSTFTGKLSSVEVDCAATEEAIYIEAANSRLVNCTTSKALGFGGAGSLDAASANNNVI